MICHTPLVPKCVVNAFTLLGNAQTSSCIWVVVNVYLGIRVVVDTSAHRFLRNVQAAQVCQQDQFSEDTDTW
eukprot:2151407-Amphidinium_carterae.1